jgi:ribosomal protein S16
MKLKFILKKNKNTYNIIILNNNKNQSKLLIDKIGNYNPYKKSILINKNKCNYWLSVGIQLSNTLIKILQKIYIIP